jgi:hypothetical protein
MAPEWCALPMRSWQVARRVAHRLACAMSPKCVTGSLRSAPPMRAAEQARCAVHPLVCAMRKSSVTARAWTAPSMRCVLPAPHAVMRSMHATRASSVMAWEPRALRMRWLLLGAHADPAPACVMSKSSAQATVLRVRSTHSQRRVQRVMRASVMAAGSASTHARLVLRATQETLVSRGASIAQVARRDALVWGQGMQAPCVDSQAAHVMNKRFALARARCALPTRCSPLRPPAAQRVASATPQRPVMA